jgi:hypothetical protein
VPPTDRLQCQEGIGGIFGRVFCSSRCRKRTNCLVTPHGPTALVLAQEAEDDPLLPARVFAWFRHTLRTPPCQGRAGANFNRRAQRLPELPQRALAVALTYETGGVNCAGRNRASISRPPSGAVWWTAQLWPVRPTPPQSLCGSSTGTVEWCLSDQSHDAP